ncbi:alanine racemase [Ornithinimicrobium cryptoxanthini]|uniref:Alanine racemase n=1 Tax=Ornithinimicrobium cryptoxanthini TaxID=2934161 RepID=A0ABY4YG43_9MICO|nr:alanine racemase [Ornithinimicrobium cryptoxanthini]USQ75727.1 alanine racemase [Ornithinimicrobium cryptoxanthini]
MTAPSPPRATVPFPARAVIDLAAIAANVGVLKQRAGAAEVMAVVKADAYGHGLVRSAQAALAGGASWLGVAQLTEAMALRAAGVTAPVLAWLHAPGAGFAQAIEADVDLGVSATWMLDEVAAAARASGRTARVQLKADTGLGRNGAYLFPVGTDSTATDWSALVDRARALEAEEAVRVTGLFTHFAYADAPQHPTVQAQQTAFAEAVALAERAGLRPEVRHMSNSAATLTTPAAAWDMVRPGLAVYGLTPAPEVGSSADFGLVPAMTAIAEASVVKAVPAGQGVSYGHTYTTSGPANLVDVPLGYADGVPRHASGLAEVMINGRRHRIAGRVCMDQFVVDVGDQQVTAGDEVILFGPGDRGEPTAQDWAEAVGTINYEIVTRFGPRVPREYAGAPVGAEEETW